VDKLIAAGHDLLRNNPEYQRFIADMGGTVPAKADQKTIPAP